MKPLSICLVLAAVLAGCSTPTPAPTVINQKVNETSQADAAPHINFVDAEVKPIAKFLANPVYPATERKAEKQGVGVIGFIAEPDGSTSHLYVVRASSELFGAAAKEAISKWRFVPGKKNGQVVRVAMQIPVEFTISAEP